MNTKTIKVKTTVYGLGGYDPKKPNNNIVETKEEDVVVPDEDSVSS
jgi:hypothetical protein